jgi:UDP:flavonoid glycosyltransferase YjiC (YdhE family)
MAVDQAPHSLVMPRAAAVVQQCGIGTLGQALRAGRPVLAVPFAHDQPDNAWRATRLGVARTIPAGRYAARRAARELALLLDDPGYAARAHAVGERVRAEDGASAACDAIEAVLRSA